MLSSTLSYAILALVQCGSAICRNHFSVDPTGITRNGTYIGKILPQLSQEVFLGIPYASAPRLKLAQPLNSTWKGTRSATEFGLTCSGFGTNPRENWPVGEDCLNLNIVRPIGTRPGDDLPILVWIYGGGFRQGAIRDPEFNTSFMVQTSSEIGRPVIVVSLNYRLSGFGFLSSKEVQADGVSNLGLRDVWKGLEWIKENIKGFGGDPAKVTVWGESAGAFVISYLIAAYRGNNSNLFQRGILASGNFFFSFSGSISSYSAQQSFYDTVVNSTGCSNTTHTLQCLRDLPFEALNASFYAINEGQNFIPTVDGDFIQDRLSSQFANKQMAPVSLIVGCNSDEGISFGQTAANTSAELSAFFQSSLGINQTVAERLLELYPLDGPSPPYSVNNSVDWIKETASVGVYSGTQTRRSYAIAGDLIFIAGRRKTAAGWNATTGKAAYSFRFDTAPSRFPLVVTPGLGVGFVEHGADLSWQFRLPYISPTPYPPIPNVTAMQAASYAMQVAWISFAATGDPNQHGLSWVPYWPSYGEGKMNFVYNSTLDDRLNLHIERDDFREEGIALINDVQ